VVAQMATLPILDAASVQYLRRQGGAFGVLYAWKTVGYMLAMLFAGLMLARFGPAVFPLVFSALCALRAAASLALPNLRRKGGPVSLARGSTGVSVYRSWLLAPLIGWSLVHATHFVLNGFLGLLWARESLSAPMIAAFIALSSVAEMAMFVAFRKLAARPPARLLIIASCVIGALRWCLLALNPPMWAIILAQLMHAGSYALGFIACTSFIAEHIDETRAAEAQSAFGAIQAAAATAGLLVFGALVEAFGASAFLFSAAVALLGALLAFVSRRWLSVRAH
jgi:PPP family 3-phenylpropionic acid transporter